MCNIFEERLHLILKCRESEKYKEEVNWISSIISSFQEEIQQYVGKEEQLKKYADESTKAVKYDAGSKYLHRGALCPSIYMSYFVGGVRKGCVVNEYRKTSQYMYSFNESNQLIKVSVLSKGTNEERYREYILNKLTHSIGIEYDSLGHLHYACRSHLAGTKVESFESVLISMDHKISEFKKEVYHYEKDQLRTIDVYTYLLPDNILSEIGIFEANIYSTLGSSGHNHGRYMINYNSQGLAVSYSSCDLVGDTIINKDYCEQLYYFKPLLKL